MFAITGNWADAATWESARGAGDTCGPPGAADHAYIDAGSGDVAVAAPGQCVQLDLTGYAGTLALGDAIDVGSTPLSYLAGTITGAGNLTCAGGLQVYAGTDLSAWTGGITFDQAAGDFTLTSNGVTLPAITVDDAATTFAMADALACAGFTMAAGVFDDAGHDVSLGGALAISGGTLTSTGTWTMTASADATCNGPLSEFAVAPGVTANLTGILRTARFTAAADSVVTDAAGAGYIYFVAAASGWWHAACRVGASVRLYNVTSTPGSAILLDDTYLRIDGNADTAITLDADIDLGAGDLLFYAANGRLHTLSLAGHGLVAGDAVLGRTGQTGGGVLNCGSGAVHLDTVAAGDACNVGNALALDTARIAATGTIDGEHIAVTSDGARVLSGALANVDVGYGDRIVAWGREATACGAGVEQAPRGMGIMPLVAA